MTLSKRIVHLSTCAACHRISLQNGKGILSLVNSNYVPLPLEKSIERTFLVIRISQSLWERHFVRHTQTASDLVGAN